jgi:hypothetical protein
VQYPREDLNLRHTDPESVALSGLSYGGISLFNGLEAFTRLVIGGCCENGWDFRGKLFQFSYRRLFMVTGEMRVPHGHADVPMPE